MTIAAKVASGSSVGEDESVERWHRHPLASGFVKTLVVLVPLVAATVVGLMVGWSIPGTSLVAEAERVLTAGVVSVAVFVLVERLTRRLLPLTMLLKLSMVFPDQAPSRFSIALRSTSVRKLQEWARSAKDQDSEAALVEKVVTLAAALNSHDRRTRGHSERTRAMAELIATHMGLSAKEVDEVRWGAFLHDIGKILVPAQLLNKAGAPTPAEWETLKRHPASGGELVEPLRRFLGSGVGAVSGHHENFDGSGYPKGLQGTDIPLSARIVAVADSFEVITAVRSYKKPMSALAAREELVRHSGTQFDPIVVRSLLDVSLGRLHWTLGLAAWMAELPLLTFIPRAAAQTAAIAAAPTVPMAAISGVAALSLGTVAAHTPMVVVSASPAPAVAVSRPVVAAPGQQPAGVSSRSTPSKASMSVPTSPSSNTVNGETSGSSTSAITTSTTVPLPSSHPTPAVAGPISSPSPSSSPSTPQPASPLGSTAAPIPAVSVQSVVGSGPAVLPVVALPTTTTSTAPDKGNGKGNGTGTGNGNGTGTGNGNG